jgi:hypothetical protein
MQREGEMTYETPSTADLAAAGDRGAQEDIDDRRDERLDEGLEERRPLLDDGELERFRSRWDSVQVRFVDEPRGSVKDADALVAELMQRLAETFADERSGLESQWERGTDVSTEDLRVALQRYRSFFDRLLAA